MGAQEPSQGSLVPQRDSSGTPKVFIFYSRAISVLLCVMQIYTTVLALAFLRAVSHAQGIDQTLVPANVHQIQQAYGNGVQIYGCQPINGNPVWVFLAPDAILYQLSGSTPQQVATHSAGPVWQWNDGSGLFGKTLQSISSTNLNSIPQLLVQAQTFGTPKGVLSSTAYVTRTNTVGGTTPLSGCDTIHIGTIAHVPYSATYTFFATN